MYLLYSEMLQVLPQLEELDKGFTSAFSRDAIMAGQTNLLFQLGLRDKKLMAVGFDMYDKAFVGFKSELMNLIGDFEKGKISREDVTEFWKEKTSEYYKQLFQAGAAASGNPFYDKLGMTKKDQAFLASAQRAEAPYWQGFLDDIENPEHEPAFSYTERAGFYAESGKAQFYNGMLMGAGDDVEIHWVLGVPMTEHCDVCPQMAQVVWTWASLPFVPRDGSTPCLFKCYCNLEIQPKVKLGSLSTVPGSSTSEALTTFGRFARLFDSAGAEVTGAAQTTVEDLYAELYKSRQMIEIADEEELGEWIAKRIGLNQQLIDFLEGRGYRATPTVSVSDLVKTITSASEMPETALLRGWSDFKVGQEVLFVRANFSSYGKLAMVGNRLSFINGKNITLAIDESKDIIFEMKDQRVMGNPREYKKFFMQIFNKKKELYTSFLELYDEAVTAGSMIPVEAAWIAFRERFINTADGWVKR